MAENTRLKELQNDMKKMLEVVEKIHVDVRKEKKISQNDLRDWSLRLRICTKKKIIVVRAQAKKRCTTNHFRPEVSS